MTIEPKTAWMFFWFGFAAANLLRALESMWRLRREKTVSKNL